MDFFAKNIVGIEFHDYSAQVVELKLSGGKFRLEAYNRITIPLNTISNGEIIKEEELRNLLISCFANANPHPITTKDVAVIFPSTKLFTHIFSFPGSLTKEEIKAAIPFEAEKVIPFAIQDIYWDFSIINLPKGADKNAQQMVVFAAIIKTTAEKYINLLTSLGLTPSILGVNLETLKFGLLNQIDPENSSIIIDIGTLSTNYLILKDKEVEYFFSSNKGGKQLITALSEEFKVTESQILMEKEKGILNKNYLKPMHDFLEDAFRTAKTIINEGLIKDIILTGEFLNLPDFYEIAKREFPDKNIFIGDPRKSLEINAAEFKPLDKDQSSLYYSTYFTNAVGIAIRSLSLKNDDGINILPDSLKATNQNKRRTFAVIGSVILMCALSLFTATYIFFKNQDNVYQRKILEIEKEGITRVLYGTRYKEILNEINSFNTQVAELSNIENELFSIPALIDDIDKLLTPGVKMYNFNFNDKDLSVKISGIADNRESLLATVQNFKTSNFISEVNTPISNYDLKYDISFDIELKLIFKELKQYGANTNN